MDADYQPFLRQAVDLQYKFHDVIDQPNDPQALQLKNDIQGLVNDVKTKRNPRDIENRVKTIQQQLKNLHSNGAQILDTSHCDAFWHSYEQMRTDLHQFQNY